MRMNWILSQHGSSVSYLHWSQVFKLPFDA